MRKRLSIVAAAAALLSVAPLGLGGGGSVQALSMQCAADPPADAGCKVVFGALRAVCTATAKVTCPPLG